MPKKVCAALVVGKRAVIGQKSILNAGLKFQDGWQISWVNVANGAWQWTFPGGGIDSNDGGAAKYEFWHTPELEYEQAAKCVNAASRELAEELWFGLDPQCFEAIVWAEQKSEIALVIFRVKSGYAAVASTLAGWLEKYIAHYNEARFDILLDRNSLGLALSRHAALHNTDHGLIFGLYADNRSTLEFRQLAYVPIAELENYVGVPQNGYESEINDASQTKLANAQEVRNKLTTLYQNCDADAVKHAKRYKAVLELFLKTQQMEFGHIVSSYTPMYT